MSASRGRHLRRTTQRARQLPPVKTAGAQERRMLKFCVVLARQKAESAVDPTARSVAVHVDGSRCRDPDAGVGSRCRTVDQLVMYLSDRRGPFTCAEGPIPYRLYAHVV